MVQAPKEELPPPATTTELYLAAILAELRAMHAPPLVTPEGTVELKEPKGRRTK